MKFGQTKIGGQLDYILRGNLSGEDRPTTIKDALSDKQIR